jgi:hypothetical protein
LRQHHCISACRNERRLEAFNHVHSILALAGPCFNQAGMGVVAVRA